MKGDKRYVKYYDQSLRKSVDRGVIVDAVLDQIEVCGEKRGVIIGEARGEKRGISIGENKGIAFCAQVYKAVQSGQQDNQLITEQCGCTIEQVEKIQKEFGI